jgi:hypothetical protein
VGDGRIETVSQPAQAGGDGVAGDGGGWDWREARELGGERLHFGFGETALDQVASQELDGHLIQHGKI